MESMNSEKPSYRILQTLNEQTGGDGFFLEVSYEFDDSIGSYICKQSLVPVAHGFVDLSVKWSGMTPEILWDVADRMFEMETKLGMRL